VERSSILHPNLKGTYYKMGFKYGTVLHKQGFKLPPCSERKMALGLQSEKIVKQFFPEILEEIRGFSDACKTDYAELASFILTIGSESPECSIFAVVDGTDTYFGRNYDMYYRFKEHIESYLTVPTGGYCSIGNTDVFVGREDGVNEKGLAVAMSGIPSHPSPGIGFPIAVRYILDNCASAESAIAFLVKIPHLSTISYTVADASGKMAVVEASPQRSAVRKPEKEGFIVSTNHFVDSQMAEIPISEPPDSRRRYDSIATKLRKRAGRLSEKYLESILSDHEGLVCSHIAEINLGTLWSTVVNLGKLRIVRAEGQPCETKYELDSRLSEAIKERGKQ
jgi:predicted choloylglycine hydrolase